MDEYHTLKDGEEFRINYKAGVWPLACCDCGLVHDITFKVYAGGVLGVTLYRNNERTARQRGCRGKMEAIEFLKEIPRSWLPRSREGQRRGNPSNSELWRWLSKSSVIINASKPKPKDEIMLPITELIFFPKGNRVTMVKD